MDTPLQKYHTKIGYDVEFEDLAFFETFELSILDAVKDDCKSVKDCLELSKALSHLVIIVQETIEFLYLHPSPKTEVEKIMDKFDQLIKDLKELNK